MRCNRILQIALVAIAFTAIGCESSNKGKIEGTKWAIEATSSKDGNQIPAGFIKLEFGADGKMVWDLVIKKLTGTYSLGMGDNVTFNLDEDVAGRKQHVEKITIDGNRLTMKDTDGTTLNFTKIVDEAPQQPSNNPPLNNPAKKSGKSNVNK